MKRRNKKRSYGDGSVYEDKARSRYVFAYYDYDESLQKSKKVRKYFKTEAEANNYANAWRAAQYSGSGEYVVVENHKAEECPYYVGEWVATYIETHLQPKMRDTSLNRVLLSAKKLAPLANTRLDKLTATQAQQLFNDLHKTLSDSTVKKVQQLLSAAYKQAAAERIIDYNPMLAITPVKVEKEEKEIFSFTEILRIFRSIRQLEKSYVWNSQARDYYTLFWLLLTTGMRIGEALALKWEDIDFQKREIHVHATKANTKDPNVIHKPKTSAGDRYIPILPTLRDTLYKRLKALQHSEGTIKLFGYIFGTRTGSMMSHQNLQKIWNTITGRAGFYKSIHTFRHTYATVMLARGIPLLEVSRILGHADGSTTLNMYGHAIPSYNQTLIKQFSKSSRRKAANRVDLRSAQ